MFDIAFSELVVIGVVALIVIGPEKLPKVARTVGLLLGRVQRYVNGVKSDISRELRFEELQRLQQEVQQGLRQAEATIHRTGQELEHEMQQLGETVQAEDVHDKPRVEMAQPEVTEPDMVKPALAESAQQQLDLSLPESVAGQAAEHFQHADNIQSEMAQTKDDPALGVQAVAANSTKQEKPD